MSVKLVEVVARTQRIALPLPLQSCDSWMFVKENPDRKKKLFSQLLLLNLFKYCSRILILGSLIDVAMLILTFATILLINYVKALLFWKYLFSSFFFFWFRYVKRSSDWHFVMHAENYSFRVFGKGFSYFFVMLLFWKNLRSLWGMIDFK